MNYEDREEASRTQGEAPGKTESADMHNHDRTTDKESEQAAFREPKKKPSMLFSVFVLSITFPGFGLVLYAMWRKDEPFLAISSLIGFILNVALIIFAILSSYVTGSLIFI